MGAEDGRMPADGAGEDGGGAEPGEGSRPSARDTGDCIVRRLVIDPSRGLLIDVPGARATTMLGEKVLGAGLAGVKIGVDVGRGVLRGPAVPPAEIAETAEAQAQPEA